MIRFRIFRVKPQSQILLLLAVDFPFNTISVSICFVSSNLLRRQRKSSGFPLNTRCSFSFILTLWFSLFLAELNHRSCIFVIYLYLYTRIESLSHTTPRERNGLGRGNLGTASHSLPISIQQKQQKSIGRVQERIGGHCVCLWGEIIILNRTFDGGTSTRVPLRRSAGNLI